jgi:hypothetical protein
MSERFICTVAQNATAVHELALRALKTVSKETGAPICVLPGRYRNATAIEEHGSDEWYVDEIEPYLRHERFDIGPKLKVLSDVRVQPTATDPLSGFEVFAGSSSCIFGHARRALRCVATTTTPKVFYTTGSITIPNYTQSKAGKKAEPHHVIGALMVEVADDGIFHIRHLTWREKLGGFLDLDRLYTARTVKKAPRAASLMLGDLHSGSVDEQAFEAGHEQALVLRPRVIATQDTLDFAGRSHHRQSFRDRYATRDASVEFEVFSAARLLAQIAEWGEGDHDVVELFSNHNDHLSRWADEHDPKRDPRNDPYFCALRRRAYEHFDATGKWPNMFEMEAKLTKGFPENVRFLGQDEPLEIAGVGHQYHGHQGINGARGSLLGFSRLGSKVNLGHSHTPGIRDGAWQCGTTSKMRLGYNAGPSSWAAANIVTHEDGCRQMLFSVAGRWRLV